jgi:predicted adenine nucleotide alpha hydrolase (AANH) superfamily ATPase
LERLIEAKIDATVFFYNPNIHPEAEYERRKAEIVRFAAKNHIPLVDADYDPANWFEKIKGLEKEPEGGARCSVCFSMRLLRTALFAHENGFSHFATSLGISRWKNLDQVNAAGQGAAAAFPDLGYWDVNWRKGGGVERGAETTKRENFYRQDYCGCVFSKEAMDRRKGL